MVLLLSCPWRDPYNFPFQSLLEKGVLSEHLHFKVLQEGANQQPSHPTQLLAGREAGLCPSQRAGVLENENELQKDRQQTLISALLLHILLADMSRKRKHSPVTWLSGM